MSVKIKYQLFKDNHAIIKSLSMNDEYLVFSSGTEENSLSFWGLNYQEKPLSFNSIQMQLPEKRPISILQWSPNGKLLATAFDKLTIWTYQDSGKRVQNNNQFKKALKKQRDFLEHRLEITALAWSPDSSKIATCSLDSKIIIIDVTKLQKIKEIDHGCKIVGISWDPYDKYIASLRFDNYVIITKINSWAEEVKISLNFPQSNQGNIAKHTSKKEDRKMDWSPDYRYVLLPNLDDRLVPVVCALDRHQNFKISQNFIGPFSSINVVRFSPRLYKKDDSIYNVFAMGDNDGNISVWALGDKCQIDSPFAFIKNHQNSEELIEVMKKKKLIKYIKDIVWNRDGNTIMASTHKKYIIVAIFDQDTFGKPLSNEDQLNYIQEIYGNVRQIRMISNIENANFNIRVHSANRPNLNQSETTIEEEKARDHVIEPKLPQSQPVQPNLSQEKVFTQQQIFVQNGKKKIIPKLQIVAENIVEPVLPTNKEQSGCKQFEQINEIKSKLFTGPQFQITAPKVLPNQYIYTLPKLKQKALQRTLLFEVVRPNSKQLSVGTLIKCNQKNSDKSEELWTDFLEGQAKIIQCNERFICIYTDKNFLYINNQIGRRCEAPIVFPQLVLLSLAANDDLLCLFENGDFKILNLKRKEVILESDITILMKDTFDSLQKQLTDDEQKGNVPFDPLIKGYLVSNDQLSIPHFLMKNYNVYSYQKKINQWIRSNQLEVQQQLIEGIDLVSTLAFNNKIKQKNQNDSFALKLIMDNQQNQKLEGLSDIQQISKIEEQLMQLLGGPVEAFFNSAYQYIKKLCDTLPMNSEKLIDFLTKLLLDKESQEYQLILNQNLKFEEIRAKIIYILSQYPKAKNFIYHLDPNNQQ